MRRIAVINQKGGVGKTTTCANPGAALARLGRRVVLVDMDAQANLSMHMAVEVGEDEPSSYSVLRGKTPLAAAIRETKIEGLLLVPSHLALSGAELGLASTFGRETLLRIAVEDWEREERARSGAAPADYLIFDCPPSLGLLSINALAAASEVLIALQTEFFALQGMSTLVDVVQLLKRRLHPRSRSRASCRALRQPAEARARVLAEIRTYFPGKVFRTPVPAATSSSPRRRASGRRSSSAREQWRSRLLRRGGRAPGRRVSRDPGSRRTVRRGPRPKSRTRHHRASRAKNRPRECARSECRSGGAHGCAEPKSTARSPSHR
jgi:chromosome partitioning protein